MKTILLCCLLFFSTSIWAEDESDRVVIKISNDTGSDCVLKKQAVLNGQISNSISFQKEIFRGQTMEFSMSSEGKYTRRKAIVLSYACGEEQDVTIFTDINRYDRMFLTEGYMLNAKHIYARFVEEHNRSWSASDQSFIILHWIFYRSSQ
ncbi:MAG: hypothetical protein NTU48_08825 [Legionellales bacterium]|nr:hypothetical protein [Legionellales bacterium]